MQTYAEGANVIFIDLCPGLLFLVLCGCRSVYSLFFLDWGERGKMGGGVLGYQLQHMRNLMFWSYADNPMVQLDMMENKLHKEYNCQYLT